MNAFTKNTVLFRARCALFKKLKKLTVSVVDKVNKKQACFKMKNAKRTNVPAYMHLVFHLFGRAKIVRISTGS